MPTSSAIAVMVTSRTPFAVARCAAAERISVSRVALALGLRARRKPALVTPSSST